MNPTELQQLIAQYPFRQLPTDDGKPGLIVTCPMRLVYCAVGQFRANDKFNKATPKKEAGVVAVIPAGADMVPLKDACKALAIAHFGEALKRPISIPDGKGGTMQTELRHMLRMPWKPQTRYKGKPGYTSDGSGYWLRAATGATWPDGSAKLLPRVIGPDKSVIPNDSPEIYSGMWARLLLRLYAYPKKTGEAVKGDGSVIAGINVDLVQVQKVGDDERITTGGNGDSAFDAIVTHGSTGSGPAAIAAAGDDWGE